MHNYLFIPDLFSSWILFFFNHNSLSQLFLSITILQAKLIATAAASQLYLDWWWWCCYVSTLLQVVVDRPPLLCWKWLLLLRLVVDRVILLRLVVDRLLLLRLMVAVASIWVNFENRRWIAGIILCLGPIFLIVFFIFFVWVHVILCLGW